MRCSTRIRVFVAAVFLAALVGWREGGFHIHAQMPDLRAMAGMAMPSADLPDGSVSVRVVKESIANNLPDVEVELHGAGPVRTARTGPDGRARFNGVPAGATVHAIALVNGERLTSSEFQVPPRGGVRTLLAAGLGTPGAPNTAPADKPTEPPPAQASPGSAGSSALSFGSNSRIVLEFSDDVLQAFYLLEIVNTGGAAVQPASPLVIDLPEVAEGATMLEGSSKQATVRGRQVSIAGPFSAPMTPVQIAFRIDAPGDTLTLAQPFPLSFQMPIAAVQKVGDMRVSSPQIARSQEVPIEANTFIMGSGPPLPANTPLTLTITGLPHHSRTALWTALLLAGVIVATGIWLAWSPAASAAAVSDRNRLQTECEQHLAALAALEQAHTDGGIEPARYEARRVALVAELERLYAALDDDDDSLRRDVA
jgi:hypothetical protein